MSKEPILSICIPIYNRIYYLRRTLERLLLDKDLFVEEIQLYISDNCSSDDLQSVCNEFKEKGLNLEYHRNSVNLNMDGNFANCFRNARGKYTLLLGSDEMPLTDFFRTVLPVLQGGDYGLIHLDQQKNESADVVVYNNSDSFLVNVNYWITFISGNIVASEYIDHIDLDSYRGTFFTQVPVYLEAACQSKQNVVIRGQFYDDKNDAVNNGGYNLFQVFVTNLYGIYESFMEKKMLSREAFDKMKEVEYKNFLSNYIINLLILRKKHYFKTDGAWIKLWNYYKNNPYAYYYLVYAFAKMVVWRILLAFRLVFGHVMKNRLS